jgi:plasmid maintenance system antidote protein VapI
MTKSSSMNRLRQVVRSQFEQEYGLPMRTVKAALHQEFGPKSQDAAANRARMVGIFVGAAAARRGISNEALARSVGISLEDAGALVSGQLAEDAFSDSLLNRLAHSIGYEVDFLRLMLGRSSVGA